MLGGGLNPCCRNGQPGGRWPGAGLESPSLWTSKGLSDCRSYKKAGMNWSPLALLL
jgi:hypothetical protein